MVNKKSNVSAIIYYIDIDIDIDIGVCVCVCVCDDIGSPMRNGFVLITICHLNKLWKIKKIVKHFDKLDNKSIGTKKKIYNFFLKEEVN